LQLVTGQTWCKVAAVGLLLSAAAALAPAAASAEAQLSPFHLRTAAASAMMLSKDQRSWLEYDKLGLLGDIQLAYSALPWLDVTVGMTGGVFLSKDAPGGLAAPMVGVLARLTRGSVVPYMLIDLGVGWTGQLLRPVARLGGGVDFELSGSLRLGPCIGLGLVTQWNSENYSTSALYAWLGLALSYGSSPAPQPKAAEVERRAEAPAAESELAPELDLPPADHSPKPPSQALDALLDRAIPTQKSELLAPVLFDSNSEALNPQGIAMLHEVARVLTLERREIELLEIAAYADARGSDTHNLELAARRAQRVREWLVAHGVAAERLQVSAQGAVDFVESGTAEQNHVQNRRVVFRILRTRQP
jgi:outer membrane protein OmpA-like peptidoglycan-associated protein